MPAWISDLRISARQLVKAPGFTLASVVVLALGIGLNAGMFSLVHALAIAGRPFADADRLVQLYTRDTRTDDYRPFSFPAYQALAGRRDLFEGVLAHNPAMVSVGDGLTSRRTFSAIVSANYFEVLGVPLVQGRTFTAEESRPAHDVPVAVATWSFWKRRGFDPALVGSTVRVNERSYTIVGITPRGFTGTMAVAGPELFFPFGVYHALVNDFMREAAQSLDRPDAYSLFLVGRMKAGMSREAVAEGLAGAARGLAAAYPAAEGHQGLSINPLPKFGTSTNPSNESAVAALGAVMLGMTLAVLLTVCLNLASMLMARGRARRKEFAVRLALGGGRGGIVRQLLIEGLLLSLVGGTLGVALGLYGLEALLASVANLLPITIALESSLSTALVGATVFFCLLATLTFALGPALKHSRADILTDLKAQAGDDPAPRRWRLTPRNPLVAGQVALSLCLLMAAGLYIRWIGTAAAVDLGFRADETVLAEVDSQMGGLDRARSLDLFARAEERLAALPGVEAASIGVLVPFGMRSIDRAVMRALPRPAPGTSPATPEDGRAFNAPWNAVGARYFDTMGIALRQGRPFTAAEAFGRGAPRVAIVDETLAERLWPGGTAIGQRIQWAEGDPAAADSAPMEVVGVVARTQLEMFARAPRGNVYVPFQQGYMSNAHFHVRPAGGAGAPLAEAVRRAIRDAAPGVPLFAVRTFADHLDASAEYWAMRLSSGLLLFFGGMAMVVALVGIYGVTAYTVSRRTREIGVRMAIGARPAEVLALILREGAATLGAGVALGWLLGVGLGRVLASQFVDMPGFDAWAFSLVPLAFAAAALAATWIPARRATTVNPVIALRTE
jgi:predicted permease